MTEEINIKEKLKELLPVGSIVVTKSSQKKIVIMGILQMQPEQKQVYDYMGVFYPEGFVGLNACVLFQHKDIAEILFRGYEDKERELFMEFFSTTFSAALEQANGE